MKLTDKQEIFCKEYLIDLNATQAAIRAGYSKKTAKDIGCQNLAKLYIAKRIQDLMQERSERVQITQDRVLQEYARLAFLDVRKLYNENGDLLHVTDLDDDTAAAISGLEIAREGGYKNKADEDEAPTYIHKYKLSDKRGALSDVARHLGMFSDKLDITSDGKELQSVVILPSKNDHGD